MTGKPREWTPAELEAMAAWERARVAEGRCPASGLQLFRGADGRLRCTICDCNGHAVEAVTGEVLPAVEDPCPHCPHSLSEHLKGRLTCMHSTETETWACLCLGPGGQG